MRDVHTPRAHVLESHQSGGNCGCSLIGTTDYFLCTCGAAYTTEMLSFPKWRCYDCGRRWVREYMRTIRCVYHRTATTRGRLL
jgi:hypothetical protein